VIANVLLKDSVVGYWSALNLHQFTEQIPNVVYVQSPNRKSDKKVFNVRYKFIQVKAEKVCGIMQMGYGNEAFRITDIEKTLLDCFDLPQYSGGYEELIRAFYLAKVSTSRLLIYGKQMNNLSVLKRLAFLSEFFDMKGFSAFQSGVQKMVNNRYSLLDPLGLNEGEFNARWRIRVNIPEVRLLEMINKMY
jgi:predicted transcriptional regulator of viral defense system